MPGSAHVELTTFAASKPDGLLAEPAHRERAHLGDAVKIAVDVDDAEVMIERRFGDEEVGDGNAMPQPMMVRKVALESKGSIEDVYWGRHELEAVVELLLKQVVLGG
jgi:hypothetical protein